MLPAGFGRRASQGITAEQWRQVSRRRWVGKDSSGGAGGGHGTEEAGESGRGMRCDHWIADASGVGRSPNDLAERPVPVVVGEWW